MEEKDYNDYCQELSRLNKLRTEFWKGLRSLRNKVFSKYDIKKDRQALKLYRIINDMWESGYKEELRRRTGCQPKRDVALRNTDKGLYESDRLCKLCKLPIEGDNPRKIYCSDKCRELNKSQRWREKNPDKKSISNYHYLKDTLTKKDKRKEKKKS